MTKSQFSKLVARMFFRFIYYFLQNLIQATMYMVLGVLGFLILAISAEATIILPILMFIFQQDDAMYWLRNPILYFLSTSVLIYSYLAAPILLLPPAIIIVANCIYIMCQLISYLNHPDENNVIHVIAVIYRHFFPSQNLSHSQMYSKSNFDDLKMPSEEEDKLFRKQKSVFAELQKFKLHTELLTDKQKTLLNTISNLKARLTEDQKDFYSQETFDPNNTPCIIVFREIKVNDSEWDYDQCNTFTEESMKTAIQPAKGSDYIKHPIYRENIFSPQPHHLGEQSLTTRYRFHPYRTLEDGTPICLEICKTAEKLFGDLKTPTQHEASAPSRPDRTLTKAC
jgi:hypothetical protein